MTFEEWYEQTYGDFTLISKRNYEWIGEAYQAGYEAGKAAFADEMPACKPPLTRKELAGLIRKVTNDHPDYSDKGIWVRMVIELEKQ